jgi:hypothetical protein
MLRCELNPTNLYPTLVLALRDMRQANARKEVTGEGDGNAWWAGLILGMAVIDTLSGEQDGVRVRFEGLLTAHGISSEDATIVWKLRNSLMHGYGLPRPSETFGRTVLLTNAHDAYAVDTTRDGVALVSVPIFCSRLVERIAGEAFASWDISLINTDHQYF